MPASTPSAPRKKTARRKALEDAAKKNVAILDRKREVPDEPVHTVEKQSVRSALLRNREYGDLPLELIDPDPDKMRDIDKRSAEYQDLVASVKVHGVLSPIKVRYKSDIERFEVVFGMHRYTAAMEARLETVPAIVKDVTDIDKVAQQIVENVQRVRVNPIDEAKIYHRWLALTGKTQQELAREIGKDKTYVSKMMAILEKLTREEQDVVAKVAPAQLPGKSLILEAIQLQNPLLRLSILRGELSREKAREVVRRERKKPATPSNRSWSVPVPHLADKKANLVIPRHRPRECSEICVTGL